MRRFFMPRRFADAIFAFTLIALGLVYRPASAEQPSGYHIVQKIPVADGWWDYAAFDPVHRRLFVSRDDGVLRLDVDSGAVQPQVIKGAGGRASVVLPGGDLVLATMARSKTAVVFDASNGGIKAVIQLKEEPDAALYDPATQLVWVMDLKGTATLVDPALGKAVGAVKIGGELEFAATDGSGTLYVNIFDRASIAVVDTRTRRVTGHYKLAGCKQPTGLAYAPAQELLISACVNGVAKVLSARTGHEIASLPIGGVPDAVIYDSQASRALIPSGASGTLSVLAVSDHDVSVIETVKTQFGTRTGALDPLTKRLYLPTAKFGSAKMEDWSPPLPGTVEILVVAPGAAEN